MVIKLQIIKSIVLKRYRFNL